MKGLFEKHNVIKTGHFKLTSGKHSNQYINKDDIYSNPMLFLKVMEAMYSQLNEYKDIFNVITGPAVAGAILAAPIALVMHKIFVYPEKVDGNPLAGNPGKWTKMIFRRGYDKILKHKRVWLVEDIITTGQSVEKTIMAIKDCGGNVVGISAIWDRGRRYIDGFPILSLINEFVPSYWPDECPYCRKGRVPLTDPKE